MSISLKSLKVIGVDKVVSDQWVAELQKPHRHYHALSHISAILHHAVEIGYGNHKSILAAAWLHDIRYDATRSDNEEISADIAREDLRGTSVDIDEVVDIIIDTKHHLGGKPIFDVFNDLDLLIFSAKAIHYDWYMRAIRQEYAFVPLELYAVKRVEILASFDEKRIYVSEHYAHCEKIAHANIQREIALLQRDPHLIEAIVV